jgi:hypothetical protein
MAKNGRISDLNSSRSALINISFTAECTEFQQHISNKYQFSNPQTTTETFLSEKMNASANAKIVAGTRLGRIINYRKQVLQIRK